MIATAIAAVVFCSNDVPIEEVIQALGSKTLDCHIKYKSVLKGILLRYHRIKSDIVGGFFIDRYFH